MANARDAVNKRLGELGWSRYRLVKSCLPALNPLIAYNFLGAQSEIRHDSLDILLDALGMGYGVPGGPVPKAETPDAHAAVVKRLQQLGLSWSDLYARAAAAKAAVSRATLYNFVQKGRPIRSGRLDAVLGLLGMDYIVVGKPPSEDKRRQKELLRRELDELEKRRKEIARKLGAKK